MSPLEGIIATDGRPVEAPTIVTENGFFEPVTKYVPQVDRLRNLINIISLNRDIHDQSYWATVIFDAELNECGTRYCAAGFAAKFGAGFEFPKVSLRGPYQPYDDYPMNFLSANGEWISSVVTGVSRSYDEDGVPYNALDINYVISPTGIKFEVESLARAYLGLSKIEAGSLFNGGYDFDEMKQAAEMIIRKYENSDHRDGV